MRNKNYQKRQRGNVANYTLPKRVPKVIAATRTSSFDITFSISRRTREAYARIGLIVSQPASLSDDFVGSVVSMTNTISARTSVPFCEQCAPGACASTRVTLSAARKAAVSTVDPFGMLELLRRGAAAVEEGERRK